MSKNGYGGNSEKDFGKAIMWYAKAAEQGHSVAQNNLKTLLYFSRTSKKIIDQNQNVKTDIESLIYSVKQSAAYLASLEKENDSNNPFRKNITLDFLYKASNKVGYLCTDLIMLESLFERSGFMITNLQMRQNCLGSFVQIFKLEDQDFFCWGEENVKQGYFYINTLKKLEDYKTKIIDL